MKEKLIAKIEEIYGYNQRRKKPVFYGYISGFKRIELILLKKRGLSCQNCIFKMYEACCLLPHKTVALDKKWKFDDECIFLKSVFNPNKKYRHEFDERMICEFYNFRPVYSKENDIRKWYEEEGDEDFFQKLPMEFSKFSEQMEMRLKFESNKNQELLNDLKKTREKFLELEEFVKFFKDEIPGVYKSVKTKFRKVKEYD